MSAPFQMSNNHLATAVSYKAESMPGTYSNIGLNGHLASYDFALHYSITAHEAKLSAVLVDGLEMM